MQEVGDDDSRHNSAGCRRGSSARCHHPRGLRLHQHGIAGDAKHACGTIAHRCLARIRSWPLAGSGVGGGLVGEGVDCAVRVAVGWCVPWATTRCLPRLDGTTGGSASCSGWGGPTPLPLVHAGMGIPLSDAGTVVLLEPPWFLLRNYGLQNLRLASSRASCTARSSCSSSPWLRRASGNEIPGCIPAAARRRVAMAISQASSIAAALTRPRGSSRSVHVCLPSASTAPSTEAKRWLGPISVRSPLCFRSWWTRREDRAMPVATPCRASSAASSPNARAPV